MSVVSLCSLFVSVSVFLCHLVFYFAVFRSPTVSLVCFFLLRFSSSHTLVYHTENCCSPIFFHLWSYKHFSVAVLRIFIAIRAEKPHIHYITFHYMMIRSHVYVLHYTCAVCDSSCYSFEHTTSMPSSNSMDSKNVHTGFAISIWGVFFLTFPSISFFSLFRSPLCKCRHKSHIYLIDT